MLTRHSLVLASVALAVVVLTQGRSQAQLPFQQRPAVSPYLNLLRGGNPAYLNYYGLVRPEIQMRAAASSIQQQIGEINQNIANQQFSGGPGDQLSTGHTVGFFTHMSYFQTMGAGGMGGGRGMGGGGRGMGGVGGGVGAGRGAGVGAGRGAGAGVRR